ncbi:acyltransferase [Pseudonocardia spinosispora]|uniref:acyltransferase n=1 Tax=Pseudonocardia spinosispora TaxID=103441 RepID=UPI0004249D7D|nr:acyltransferase [Pseudonocardia spinosispora]
MTEVVQRARSATDHVYPVDMVRALTFGCVIAVHTISTVNAVYSVPWNGAVMLLHFTREAFFVLTAFVLTSRYRLDPVRPRPFWRRRFLLVGVPYLVWSVIYTGLGWVTAPVPATAELGVLVRNIATGTAWFHLYFLLISLQFYVLFPLFQRLLRATRGRHTWLVATSAVLQALTYLWLHDPAPVGVKAAVLPYAGVCFLSYQFFLVAGGVAALHRAQLEAWLVTHRRWVLSAVVVTGLVAEGRYIWSVTHGATAEFAADVFQPVIAVWSVAVVAAIYTVGVRWAMRRDDGRLSRFVERASDRSFGVFLVHPTILWALTVAGPTSPAAYLPAPLSSLAVYPVAVLGALAFVEIMRRTPLSLVLTGKRWMRTPRPAPEPMRRAEPVGARS